MEINRQSYTSLADAFEQVAETFSDMPAYSCFGKEYSFANLNKLSDAFAAYLSEGLGLAKGDRIAIQLPNLYQYPVAVYGAFRAGLVVVNTNPLYTKREVLHQFKDAGVRTVVVLEQYLSTVESVIAETDIEQVIVTNVFDMIEPQPVPSSSIKNLIGFCNALEIGKTLVRSPRNLTQDDIALLQYTGGTTGVAKGAILTHRNLIAASKQIADAMESPEEPGKVVISPMPIYHIYGFINAMITSFCGGAKSVLITDPRDIDGMIEIMKDNPCHAFSGINTLFAALMQHPDFSSIDFSKLEGTISGGAALVPELADEWIRRTGSPIYEGYGLSETAAMVAVNTRENFRLGTVGKPVSGTEVKVVDNKGQSVDDGCEGELLVRGPQVMHGYWDQPDTNDTSIDADGWFRTGDIARIEEGYIRIVDRLKDMILVSGFNVYPNEIEAVVHTHPDVVECAVVGIPDDRTGEAVKLYVVTANADLTESDIKSFCRNELTAYKVPKFIEFRQELPKSNVGKILRRELREVTR